MQNWPTDKSQMMAIFKLWIACISRSFHTCPTSAAVGIIDEHIHKHTSSEWQHSERRCVRDCEPQKHTVNKHLHIWLTQLPGTYLRLSDVTAAMCARCFRDWDVNVPIETIVKSLSAWLVDTQQCKGDVETNRDRSRCFIMSLCFRMTSTDCIK